MSATASDTPTVAKRIHLNHAGASSPPQCVTDRVLQHWKLEEELGGYAAQDFVAKDLDEVYQNVASLINARSSEEIALVESATVGWTRAFYAMVQQEELRLQRPGAQTGDSGDKVPHVILISEAEYAANVVPACQWARDHTSNNWMVLAIPSSKTTTGKSSGIVDLKVLDRMLSDSYEYTAADGKATILDPSNIVMVCTTHVPTNSGIINPVEGIGDLIAAYNQRNKREKGQKSRFIRYLVDACQSVGHLEIDVQRIQCHALVATGRKYLRAPRGTGFLYMAQEMLENDIMPSHVDHFGCPVSLVPSAFDYREGIQLQQDSVLQFAALPSARRFEFWESNVANRLGLGEAVRYTMEQGPSQIEQRILKLSTKLREKLSDIPGLTIHHGETTTCGIVTFDFEGVKAKDLQATLWHKGFELSVVPATSTPMDSSTTKAPDLLRASVTYISTDAEISVFCTVLASSLDLGARNS